MKLNKGILVLFCVLAIFCGTFLFGCSSGSTNTVQTPLPEDEPDGSFFNGSKHYDRGHAPTVAVMDYDNVAVEVHSSTYGEMWYHVGRIASSSSIDWGKSHCCLTPNGVMQFEGVGNVSVSDEGTVALMYNENDDDNIQYSIGNINFDNDTIDWGNDWFLRRGGDATMCITKDGHYVIAVYLLNDGLTCRVGRVDLGHGTDVEWGDENKFGGFYNDPNISINSSGMIFLTYYDLDNDEVYYQTGRFDEDNQTVNWYDSYNLCSGMKPNGAISMDNGIMLVHQSKGSPEGEGKYLYYHLGSINFADYSVTWSQDVQYDTGHDPAVAFGYNRSIVQVHKSAKYGDNDKLWYYMAVEPPEVYGAGFVSQSNPEPYITANRSNLYTATFQNTGTATWKKGDFFLSTWPIGTIPQLLEEDIYSHRNSGWATKTTVDLLQDEVQPGGEGNFQFFLSADDSTKKGEFLDQFIVTGNDEKFLFPFPIIWITTVVDPSEYYGAELVSMNVSPALRYNQSYLFTATYKNTGFVEWDKETVFLGTSDPYDRIPQFIRGDIEHDNPSGWAGDNRIFLANGPVMPGDTGEFKFYMSVPEGMFPTAYLESFQPVTDQDVWFGNDQAWWVVTVVP